jgi:outer membrane receptor protein involved in Fe transport
MQAARLGALLGLLAALGSVSPAFGDDASSTTIRQLAELSPEELSMIRVVTPSKSEVSMLDSPGTIYVVTEADIRRYGWRDLKEILAAIPNLDLSYDYNWLKGGQRGFTGSFNGTLLLIDGREVNNLLAGEAFIANNFPSHRIKRVEIVMGPSSAIYGSDAMQGVINVITKTGAPGQKDTSEAEVIVGDVNTRQYAGVFRKTRGDTSVGLSASYFSSDLNYKSVREFAASPDRYSRDPFKDRFRDLSSDGFWPEQDVTFDVYASHKGFYAGENFSQIENFSGLEQVRLKYGATHPRRTFNQAFAGYGGDVGDGGKWKAEYQYAVTQESFVFPVDVDTPAWTSFNNIQLEPRADRWDSQRSKVQTQLNYALGERHSIVAGYEFSAVDIGHHVDFNTDLPGPSAPSDANAASHDHKHTLFAEDSVTLVSERLKAVLGVSYNHETTIHDSVLPRVSLIGRPTGESAIKYTYSEGVRPPNVLELKGANTLSAQKMTMHELNYTQTARLDELSFSNVMAVYHMVASNFYTTISDGMGGNVTVVRGSLASDGFEDMLRVSVWRWSGFAGVRWVHTQDMNDVPETKEKLGVSYSPLDRLVVSSFVDCWAKTRTMAPTPDGSSLESHPIPAWASVDLNVSAGDFDWDGMRAGIALRVGNLLDSTYYNGNSRGVSPYEYLQPPRNYRLTASLKF